MGRIEDLCVEAMQASDIWPTERRHKLRGGHPHDFSSLEPETLAGLEIETLLRGIQAYIRNLYPHHPHAIVCYTALAGSWAYGLATEESDIDIRCVYAAPPRSFWELKKIKDTLEVARKGTSGIKTEAVCFELGKFASLILKCNPNTLEILYSPYVFQTSWKIRMIREHFPDAFLNQTAKKSYCGFATAQIQRARGEGRSRDLGVRRKELIKQFGYDPIYASHAYRLIICAKYLFENRIPLVQLPQEVREPIREIKAGKWTWEKFLHVYNEADEEMNVAFEKADLPEEPNYDVMNRLLVAFRKADL